MTSTTPKAPAHIRIVEMALKVLKRGANAIIQSAPPRPVREVEELMNTLGVALYETHMIYKVFHSLKRRSSNRIMSTALEVPVESLIRLVSDRKEWVLSILQNLVELGGCFTVVPWDNFLYIFLRFCSLSKIELCQLMFYIIVKEVKSWTIHYLTSTQLDEFYDHYQQCPVRSFNTGEIRFARLPAHRYYISDFVELCHRFGQLINPLLHLQRSVQQRLPALSFWENYDRTEIFNRRLTLEFFLIKKTHVFLRGEPGLRETASQLEAETLSGLPTEERKRQEIEFAARTLMDQEKLQLTLANSNVRQISQIKSSHIQQHDLLGAINTSTAMTQQLALPSTYNPLATSPSPPLQSMMMQGSHLPPQQSVIMQSMAPQQSQHGIPRQSVIMQSMHPSSSIQQSLSPQALASRSQFAAPPPQTAGTTSGVGSSILMLGSNRGSASNQPSKEFKIKLKDYSESVVQGCTKEDIRRDLTKSFSTAPEYEPAVHSVEEEMVARVGPENAGQMLTSVEGIPKWMKQYVNTSTVTARGSMAQRQLEVEFIRSGRDRGIKIDNTVHMLESMHTEPLLPRPVKSGTH